MVNLNMNSDSKNYTIS